MDIISTERKLIVSEDDLQKLRQIVQRQKAEVARRKGVPSNALLTSTEDSNVVAHPVATFTDSEPSRLPVNRKVAECSSPPAYRGFSSVIHIARERTCDSARSSAPQADLHTRSRKVAHPTSARSGGMITTSDWRLGSQLIQKFFGSKIEQSPTQSVDQKSDRLVSPKSQSLLHKVDVKVTEEEPRTASAKDTNDGETVISNSQILNDGPRVGSTMHSLEEDVANTEAPSLVGQKRPAAASCQKSARNQAKSGQQERSQHQQHQQQHNQEQPAGATTERGAVAPVPDREALRALVRQQRKERQEKRQRELEAAELTRTRIARNLQLTAQKAAAAATQRGRHGPPPHKPPVGAWNDTVTSQPNEYLPSMDAVTRSSEFPATTLQALGASNSNADVVGESGRLRLLTMFGDRVPSELARRASELLAEAEDSAHVDDNGSRAGGRRRTILKSHVRPKKQTDGRAPAADTANAVDRTVRARRLPSPPHLNNPPPASSVLRVDNSLSAGGDGVRPQQKGVPCSTQAQYTPIGTFTHAVRDRPSDANTVTNKIRVTDYNNGLGVGCLSSSLTRGAHTVADSKQQKAMQAAAANAKGPTVRHPISNDRINPPHSGENADHNAHRKYLTSLSARNHAHFSSQADPCTQEALCKARISANRTRRLLNLEAVGDPAASDSESPFTPSTDDETLGTLPGGDDDRWFCLEASSDEVGSADDEAAVVSDQLYSAADLRHHHNRQPCHNTRLALRVSGLSERVKNGDVEVTRNTDFQFEPDPLRFMSVYRQKCRMAAPAPDVTAHVPCKPNAEVPTEDAKMTPEVAIPRPLSRTVVDATANHNHRDSESITSTALHGTTRTKSSHNSSARSTLSTSSSQSAGGAKHIFVGSLPPAPTGPPRLTAAALGLSLTANVNRLDALAASIEQLQGMESLRQLSLAQAESVSLAQLIQCGQVKESFGINQPASTNRQPSEFITSNQNHRTVKEEDPPSVDLQTRKPVAVVSSSCGSSQNESSAAVISTSISARNTLNTSSSRILEITHTARPRSAQDSTLRTSSANASLVLDSDVGAVSEAIQSVAEVSNSQLDPGISVRTSRQTSVLSQEAEPQIAKSHLTHHVFPKALDRPSLADKSLNTTNDLLTAIEALDQPVGETSKTAKAEKAVDASDFGGQILRLDSEDYKGLYKLRAEELRRRKHKAQLVMLLSERLALQESEVVQLESKALQSLRRKLAEPPKLTPPLVGRGGVRTPASRKRAALSRKRKETHPGDSTEPEEESVSGAAVVSSDRLKLRLPVDQEEEGTSASISVSVAASSTTTTTTTTSTSTTASSLVSMSARSIANDYATTACSSSKGGDESLPNTSARSAISANVTDVPSLRAKVLSARNLSMTAAADATGQDAASTGRTSASAAAVVPTYSTGSFIEESSAGRPHGSRAATPRSTSSATLTPEHTIDLRSSTSARTLTQLFDGGVVLSAQALSPLPSGNKSATGDVSEPPQPRPTGSGDELSADSLEPEISTASGLSHRERRISADASEGDSSAAVATGSSVSLRQRHHRRDKESRLCARSMTEVGNGGDCEWRSQLYAMIDNLVKQERLLARLDRSGSGGNKHELKRFAKTLSKHRQMCTQIIERIHGDLVAHYSREGTITGDDGSRTSLSLRPFTDDLGTSATVLSPSALLAEVVVSASSGSSAGQTQPATVVAGSAVASPQRDRSPTNPPTTASIVDVCPVPSVSAETVVSHHSEEEEEEHVTLESPTSVLSEYSGSIDDQTPNLSRPQTTMSNTPSDRLSPENLERRPESLLPSVTTHGTAPTPTLVDAEMNTSSPREELSSVDSSRHRVLDMFSPRASTSNDQKVVESVSDNVKQEVFEESPRRSYKLSTPQPSLRSISSADLPLSEPEFLARPPNSVSVKSGVLPANELGVSRPQSATPLSVIEDARDGASSGTLSKSSPRIKSAGREPVSPALSPAKGPESQSELPSALSHAADDLTTEHASADLAITDKVSAKNETPRSADDVTTKGQTSAASQIDVKSPHSSEPSQSAADASVAEKDDERSKVGSPVVSSQELQSNADNAVEQQPTIVANAGDPSLAPATSTVDECTLLMAEEYDINESSISDDNDDEDNDSACERILQLSLSPRVYFDDASSPAAKVVDSHPASEAQPPALIPEGSLSPRFPQSAVADAATPPASSAFSPPAGQLGNKVGSPLGPSARKAAHLSKDNGRAQVGKSSLLDTLISPPAVLEPGRQQPAEAASAAVPSSTPATALARTADARMGVGKSKRVASSPPPPPASPSTADAASGGKVTAETPMAGVSEPTKHALAAVATNLFNELLNNAVNTVLAEDAGRAYASIKPSQNVRQKMPLSQKTNEDEEKGQFNGELNTVVLEPTDEFFRMLNRKSEEERSEESVSTASDESSSDAVSVGEPSPVGLSPEAVRGLIANTPDRIHSLVTSALQHFWSFRSTSDGGFEAALRNAQPPELFFAEYSDEEDVALATTGKPVTFVNRMLVFEYLRELLLRIYDGEDEEKHSSVKPEITSSQFRLWKGLSRPTSLERLSSLVTPHLQSDLALNLQQSSPLAPSTASSAAAAAASQFQRMPKLTQWTLNRKNWLDQLLELEMRADEATWINYAAYEEEIKQSLVTQVLDELLESAVCTVFKTAKGFVGASSRKGTSTTSNQRFSPDSSQSRQPSSVISVS